MLIRWLGQAGYELKNGDFTIMIDPYLSDLVEKEEGLKRLVPPPIQCEQVKADVILFTHDHIDHLDYDLVQRMEKGKTMFVGPNSGREILIKCGVSEENIISIERGEHFTLGDIKFDAVFAEHTEDSVGYVMHDNGSIYYFTGDSLFHPKVGCIYGTGEPLKADLIFTCINGKLGNMSVEEAVELTKRVKAEVGIPNHYHMFAENTEDPLKYVEGLKNSGCVTKLLEWNKEYDLEVLRDPNCK